MRMQTSCRKLLLYSILFGTFGMIVIVHTFFQRYGNISLGDIEVEIEAIQNTAASEDILKRVGERRIKFKMPVKGDKNIIFLETTCILNLTGFTKDHSKLLQNDGRACAIESAAKANPNSSIYLFYSCPLEAESLVQSDDVTSMVLDYPNVHFWHQSIASIFTGTPLEELYMSGQIKKSKYPIVHGADVLRFLLLWTFGGIYLDMDFIVLRSFDSLGPNFVGTQDSEYLNSAAVGLASSGLGAEIAQDCIDELRTNFRGDVWGFNGPEMITRVMRKRCGTEGTENMTTAVCKGFNVLPKSVFYPIYYPEWRLFYSEASSNNTMPKLSSAVAVHLWNSMKVLNPDKIPVEIKQGSKQPIALLHEKFCPAVNKFMIDKLIAADSLVVTTQ